MTSRYIVYYPTYVYRQLIFVYYYWPIDNGHDGPDTDKVHPSILKMVSSMGTKISKCMKNVEYIVTYQNVPSILRNKNVNMMTFCKMFRLQDVSKKLFETLDRGEKFKMPRFWPNSGTKLVSNCESMWVYMSHKKNSLPHIQWSIQSKCYHFISLSFRALQDKCVDLFNSKWQGHAGDETKSHKIVLKSLFKKFVQPCKTANIFISPSWCLIIIII